MTETNPTDGEQQVQQRVLDAAALKALAHPLRVRILDTLSIQGPMTASGLGEQLGESSGATSYHLRQLEKHELVRDVPGRGTARERWWERMPGSLSLRSNHLEQSASVQMASDLVSREWQRGREELLSDFLARGEQVLPVEWAEATDLTTANMRLTLEQFRELTLHISNEILRYTQQYYGQRNDPPPGSRAVQLHFNSFPVLTAPPTPEAPSPDDGSAS